MTATKRTIEVDGATAAALEARWRATGAAHSRNRGRLERSLLCRYFPAGCKEHR